MDLPSHMKVYPRFHVKLLRPYYQRDNIVHSVAPFVSDSEEIEFVPLSIQNVRFHASNERQFLIVCFLLKILLGCLSQT